jgi:hypothetical protein
MYNARRYSFATARCRNRKNTTSFFRKKYTGSTASRLSYQEEIQLCPFIRKYGYSTECRLFDSEIILLPSSVPTFEKNTPPSAATFC